MQAAPRLAKNADSPGILKIGAKRRRLMSAGAFPYINFELRA